MVMRGMVTSRAKASKIFSAATREPAAMAFQTILLDIENGAARLTLNRPDRLNSFTVEMHHEVAEVLTRVERDDEIRVLLITGAGRGFCAGQDLADRAVAPGAEGVDLGESLENRYNPLIRRLVELPKPVVCAVNGVAAGAGANIAFAADIVLAAKSAKFIQSFSNIGLLPDSGGTWILPRLVGHARALGLALTGEPISAEKAESWGLIWRAVDDDQMKEEAEKLVARLAGGPTRGYAAIKQAMRRSWLSGLNEQLDLERDLMRELGRSNDYREGVAAFTEKRKPNFTGR
ncbi:MAG TPA: 2-(1,2-epoxy-1,2-dihydrophenyl)acetyl-CoA isomerase PaaG [Rhizomicrobium sp.]|jgi:2-(1,2-epoxy-1,2-dihydrophenyl)acetyl-CoA isomerase|nr:2-(1,2-epoxy-1,2-dihydrophenyl)acetyl-CoA isomerase PaaG [Rhizomicrobium sp.]